MGLIPILYPLPRCPPHWLEGTIAYPTVFITLCVTTLLCFVCAVIVGARYNSVRVWNKKIRPPSISNTLWVIFYLCIFCRAILDGVRYGVPNEDIKSQSLALATASFAFHGLTTTVLSLALNHQRRFRSSVAPAPATGTSTLPEAEKEQPTAALTQRLGSFTKQLGIWEFLFGILLVGYLVLMYLDLLHPGSNIIFPLFLTAFGLQRLPILVLAVLIAGQGQKDGPTKISKLLLCIGVVLNVVNDLPLSVWAQFLPPKCFFGIFSAVDILHSAYLVSLVFFFLFIRSEYHRNMEECIWTTVSQIQDTFDFRKF